MMQATQIKVLFLSVRELAPELVTTLRQLSWGNFWIDDETRQLTASRHELLCSEGMLWDLHFRCAVTWTEHDSGIAVTVSVLEPFQSWTEFECERRLTEIIDRLETVLPPGSEMAVAINCAP